MFPIDTTGLVGLNGLLTQCAVAWIFVAFFAVLARSTERRWWFRDWTLSFLALAIGLSAMSVRFAWPLYTGSAAFGAEGDLEVRVAYVVYGVAKVLHATLLGLGTFALMRDAPSRRRGRGLIAAAVVTAFLVALAAGDLTFLMLVQSPMMALGLGASLVMFLRLPAERRSAGTRTAVAALGVATLLWVLYTIAFAVAHQRADGVTWPVRRDLWTALLNYNSYFDLAVMVTLAAGLSATLLEDAQRRLRILQDQRETLAAELARDEKLRALGTLVSGVAHELNNPLAAIQAAAEELRSVERSDVRRLRLEDLIGEVRRTSGIVETLTGLRHESGGALERIRADALLERVLDGARELALEREVTLERTGDLHAEVSVEVRALERALSALVDNALRASPRGGRVRVTVRRDGEATTFAVADQGPGVPEELHARVFEPFFTTRSDAGHLGLGLSVAHATARMHEGTLSIVADAHGSRFELRLPHEGSAARPRVAPVPERALRGPLRIVVVEDEPMLRDLLGVFGRRQGWTVECAADGQSALRLLSEGEVPDCVLCDVRMPGLDGRELLRRVRERDPELAQRFLFQSGDVGSSEARAIADETGLPVLEKPLSFERLRECIEAVAGRRTAGATP